MKIAVILGGVTPERLVSIASGSQIAASLRRQGHDVQCFDTAAGLLSAEEETALFAVPAGEAPPQLQSLPRTDRLADVLVNEPGIRSADVVFNALHGGSGEDGTASTILRQLDLRYTGSSPLPTAMAMDKGVAKSMYRHFGVLTPDWISSKEVVSALPRNMSFPVIVKPSSGGSTIGVAKVHEPSQLMKAQEDAFLHDSEILIEQFIPGQEYVVGVLGDTPLGIGMIQLTVSELFDYRSKYHPGGCNEIFPAPIEPTLTSRLQERALAAHRALKLDGYSRSDFIHAPNDEIWCLETNVLPGMTSTSLMPQSAQAVGMGFDTLCARMVDQALSRKV